MEAAAAAAAGGGNRRTTEMRTTRRERWRRGMGATPAALGLPGGEPCLGASTVDAVLAVVTLMLLATIGVWWRVFAFQGKYFLTDRAPFNPISLGYHY